MTNIFAFILILLVSPLFQKQNPIQPIPVSSITVVKPTEERVFHYTVKRSDNLMMLADRFYGDGKKCNKILEANKGKINDPHKIMVGQVISIPVEEISK